MDNQWFQAFPYANQLLEFISHIRSYLYTDWYNSSVKAADKHKYQAN